MFSRFDAVCEHRHIFPILKIVESMVIVELCLGMMVLLVSVYVLDNPP